MVLQDIDTQPEADGTPQTGEDDAYANVPIGSRFDASSLPRPIPILGPMLGHSDFVSRYKTEFFLKHAETKLPRPVTSPEAQALAAHLYLNEQQKSYVSALGVAAGSWRWYQTMAEFRYPFYLPKGVNPDKFMFVRGPMAQYARHSWRLLLYTVVAGQLSGIVANVVLTPSLTRSIMNDPELAQFGTDLKTAVVQIKAAENNRRTQHDTVAKREIATRERNMREEGNTKIGENKPWNPQPSTSDYEDDMSPTAGNDPWAPMTGDIWGNSESSKAPSNAQSRQQPVQTTSAWSRRKQQSNDHDADTASTEWHSRGNDDSPIRSEGSAWERLRQGGVQRAGNDDFAPPRPDEERGMGQRQKDDDVWMGREASGKDQGERRW